MPDKEKKINPKQEAINSYKDSVRQAESNGNTNAKSSTSSATGLYQFTKDTWKEMERKLGKKLDIFSQKDQELAMNKLTEINVAALEKNNIPITPQNLYMTHFLGVTGGPKFLKNLQKNPNELANKYASAGAVNANKNLFYKDDKPVSAAELYNTMSSKVGGEAISTDAPAPQVLNLQPEINLMERDNTSVPAPRIDRNIKPSKSISPKQVSDNDNLQSNSIENTRQSLGLSGDLDFLPKDINLAFSEDEQSEQEQDEIAMAKFGGKQTTTNAIDGGDTLIEFNEGGKHEENKFGGIPQGVNNSGQLNTVEEGETKFNDYVFSDTLKLNDGDVESLFLPKQLANKTFAEASKFINSILEDNPNDRIIKKTVEKQLDSLTLGNEKARLAKEQLDSNLQNDLSLDLELTDTDSNQMFLGGSAGTNGMNNSQQTNGWMQVAQGASAAGNAMGDGNYGDRYGYDPKLQEQYNQMEGAKDGVASAIPVAGFFRGIEKLGKGVGTAVGGEKGGDIAGGVLDPFSSQAEIFKNENSTTGQKAMAVIAPFASGFITNNVRKKSQSKITAKHATALNSQYNQDYAYGGDLSDEDYIGGNGSGTINNNELTQSLAEQYFASKNDEYITLSEEDLNSESGSEEAFADLNKNKKFTPKQKNLMQYAPILGDFLNYMDAKKDKPEVERLNKLSNRFQADYADENILQNIVNNDYNNTINSLENASNGSLGALRSNILGATSNRAKNLSDAYLKMDAINRDQNMQGQQFNLGIDQFNIGQNNQERDINARNRAAVEDRQRSSRDALYRDIGSVGREQTYDNRLFNLTGGYDSMGNYNPNRTSYLEELGLYSPDQKKQGGFLSTMYNSQDFKKKKQEEDFNNRYR